MFFPRTYFCTYERHGGLPKTVDDVEDDDDDADVWKATPLILNASH